MPFQRVSTALLYRARLRLAGVCIFRFAACPKRAPAARARRQGTRAPAGRWRPLRLEGKARPARPPGGSPTAGARRIGLSGFECGGPRARGGPRLGRFQKREKQVLPACCCVEFCWRRQRRRVVDGLPGERGGSIAARRGRGPRQRRIERLRRAQRSPYPCQSDGHAVGVLDLYKVRKGPALAARQWPRSGPAGLRLRCRACCRTSWLLKFGMAPLQGAHDRPHQGGLLDSLAVALRQGRRAGRSPPSFRSQGRRPDATPGILF